MKTVVLLLVLSALKSYAQDTTQGLPRDTANVTVSPSDSTAQLPHGFVQHQGFTVRSGSNILPDSAFSVDWIRGRIHINDTTYLPRDSAHPVRLNVVYEYVPLQLKDSYYHRRLELEEDSTGHRNLTVKTKSAPLTIDNLFGAGFQKNGTLIRGVTAGNRQDVALTSGFQLQFSGKVAGDVEVTGSLTDNNTPIQPEGNTQTLQELDKVFITIKAPGVGGTLGDFVTTVGGTDLANVSRKVEGGEAEGHVGGVSARAIAATTRGKYRTMAITGIEGVQGPYRLTGDNGENGIIVVAGTEHVFIDGIAQMRGENLDYIIDYSTAEIIFSSRRQITSASRITVDFEFSDHTFARSLIAAQSVVQNADSSIRFTATYEREADNQDAPLDITISDADKTLLANAGGDRQKASRTGVVDAGVDSITLRGRGLYVRRDTVINGKPDSMFVYLPGDSLARYTVQFTFVGAGSGSYTRIAGQQYQFVGSGSGDYVPIVYLAMPRMTQIIDGRMSATITQSVTANAEFALSNVSLNRFSSLPDAQMSGTAGTLTFAVAPQKLGGAGVLEGSLRLRALAPTFTAIDRIDNIEFNRTWNLPATTVLAKQNIIEGNATYAPVEKTTINATLGEMQTGDAFKTLRQQYSLASTSVKQLAAEYKLELLQSTGLPGLTSSDWMRQMGDARYTVGVFTPGFHFESERRSDLAHRTDSLSQSADTLAPSSFSFVQWAPRLLFAPAKGISFTTEYGVRKDDSVSSGIFRPQSTSTTYRAGFDLSSGTGYSSSAEFSVRNRDVDSAFLAGGASSRSVLFRLQGAARPANGAITADVFYSAASQRAAKLERVFVLVPYGLGQYKYLGDLNSNGVQDEQEFTLTNANDGTYVLIYRPTDALYPIIDLKTSLRVRLKPSALFGADPSGVERVLSWLSTETYVRVDERSTTPSVSDIYLLRLSHFLDPQTTMNGTQLFQQDVILLENNADITVRGRYSERRTLTELATTGEAAYLREQSLRVRWHMISELTSELTGGLFRDDLSSTGPSVNTPRRLGTTAFTSDLSYRPIPEFEFGWKADERATKDDFVSPAVTANKDFQTVRAAYSFAGFGRLSGELERDNVTLGTMPTGYVTSFQLTDGFASGITYITRANFEYRVTANVQATASYTGRLREGSLPVHTFSAEVRAMF